MKNEKSRLKLFKWQNAKKKFFLGTVRWKNILWKCFFRFQCRFV